MNLDEISKEADNILIRMGKDGGGVAVKQKEIVKSFLKQVIMRSGSILDLEAKKQDHLKAIKEYVYVLEKKYQIKLIKELAPKEDVKVSRTIV